MAAIYDASVWVLSSGKSLQHIFYIFQGKKRNSLLSFCDLIDYSNCKDLRGLPRWLSDKEHQCRRLRFDPWVRKIPWRRKWLVTHSNILAWEISWTEEPGGLLSTGSQRVGHNIATELEHTGIIESPIMLSWICRHYSVINDIDKNHNLKNSVLLIKLFFILKLSLSWYGQNKIRARKAGDGSPGSLCLEMLI